MGFFGLLQPHWGSPNKMKGRIFPLKIGSDAQWFLLLPYKKIPCTIHIKSQSKVFPTLTFISLTFIICWCVPKNQLILFWHLFIYRIHLTFQFYLLCAGFLWWISFFVWQNVRHCCSLILSQNFTYRIFLLRKSEEAFHFSLYGTKGKLWSFFVISVNHKLTSNWSIWFISVLQDATESKHRAWVKICILRESLSFSTHSWLLLSQTTVWTQIFSVLQNQTKIF